MTEAMAAQADINQHGDADEYCIDTGSARTPDPHRPIPTVTDQDGIDGIELHPGEVMQRFPSSSHPEREHRRHSRNTCPCDRDET